MNRLKTTLLLSLLTVLMLTMGSAIGGKSGMVFAFIMALGMNFFSYWFSDKIVLRMYGAQVIGEQDHPAFYGMLGSMLQWGAMFGAGRSDDEESGAGGLIGSLVMAIIAPIAAMLIQMAVSRSREYLADEAGARICGRPLALADALRKLHTASPMIPLHDARPATLH